MSCREIKTTTKICQELFSPLPNEVDYLIKPLVRIMGGGVSRGRVTVRCSNVEQRKLPHKETEYEPLLGTAETDSPESFGRLRQIQRNIFTAF